MKFQAYDYQIKRMVANAILASKTRDLEKQKYQYKIIYPEDIKIRINRNQHTGKKWKSISLDYFKGQMVRIKLVSREENIWETKEDKINPEYQTWGTTYETWEALANTVEGISIYKEPSIFKKIQNIGMFLINWILIFSIIVWGGFGLFMMILHEGIKKDKDTLRVMKGKQIFFRNL